MTEFAQNFDKQLNRLGKEFQAFFNKFASGAQEGAVPEFFPVADVIEDNEVIMVLIDLPGISKIDTKLTFAEGELRLEGTRSSELEEDKANFKLRERGSGDFTRTLTLPAGADEKSIKAKFTNGVLKVTISKTEVRKPKTSITIE
ncbi:MAG: Hsp20/alpha crystallin family protein [Balneolales bacterium]